MPNPPGITLTVVYDDDGEAGADALLAVLRAAPPPKETAPESADSGAERGER